MSLSWFCRINPAWVTLSLMCAMIATAEVGYRIGLSRHEFAGDKGRVYFATMLGSMLGLLALLLGFTFNMSAQRYETRRLLVIEAANSLNAVYLQSSLLPEPDRKRFKPLLRDYVGAMVTASTGDDFSGIELSSQAEQIEAIYRKMWESARGMVQSRPPAPGAEQLLDLLNGAESVSHLRFFAYMGRVPVIIVMLLLCSALVAMAAVGFASGLSHYRGWTARITLMLLIAGTIFIILNLDQPRGGLIRVDQSPIILMRQVLDRDPEARPHVAMQDEWMNDDRGKHG